MYSFHAMREEQLASYTLLKLDYPQMSLAEADAVLQKSVRENDVWGISEKKKSCFSFFRRRTGKYCRSFLQDWRRADLYVMKSMLSRVRIK